MHARAGRIIGVLIAAQLVIGFVVNFALEAPIFAPPGFLTNAAPHWQQIALGALLGLAAEALWLAVAVLAFPALYTRAQSVALGFVALTSALLAVAVVESAAVMSMVSVSDAYAKANALQRAEFDTLRVVVASARNWPHFLARMMDGLTIVVFYVALLRLKAIPRALGGFGLIAAALQILSVARPLFQREVVFPMLAPLGVAQLLVAIWLVVRSFPVESPQAILAPRVDV